MSLSPEVYGSLTGQRYLVLHEQEHETIPAVGKEKERRA